MRNRSAFERSVQRFFKLIDGLESVSRVFSHGFEQHAIQATRHDAWQVGPQVAQARRRFPHVFLDRCVSSHALKRQLAGEQLE